MARMDTNNQHDNLNGGAKPRVIVKKKGGLLGKIVALLLGIVIGIIAGIGGLVGAGYYIATQMKIKDATNTVTNLSGLQIPLSDYLADEYADKTILGLIESVADTATKIGEGTGTLNDLNDISPLVGKFLNQEGGLVEMLTSFGIETTADELMSKYLVKTVQTENRDNRYLTDFLLSKVDEIPFAKLIDGLGFDGNEIFTTLCYGIEGVDYQIQDGKYVMLGNSKPLTIGGFMGADLTNRIERLPLDAIMDAPQDEIMRTLFYGAAHRYTQTENGVVMNQVFYTYDGESFYNDNDDKLDLASATALPDKENTYLLTFKDGTKQLVQLGADNKGYAFTTDATPQIIRFPKTKIGDLEGEAQNLINGITLESALKLNEESHAILKSIAYDEKGEKRTIKDLREQGGNLINGIQLSEIISADTDNTIVMYLLYGKENVHYSIDPTTKAITPLQKRVALYNGKVYNEYGELIENAKANNAVSYTQDGITYNLVADASLGTVQVKITNGETTTKHDATLYYVTQGGANVYYAPTTIGDMQNGEILSSLTGRLQLQDVMDVGDNKLLKHLGEETIDELPDAINSLTIDDVFGDQFYYRTYNPTTGIYASYRENGNHEPIDESGNLVKGVYMIDINNKNVDYNNDGIVTREEADKALTGTWKYLLMERKTDGTFTINHHHTIIEMDGMVDYMSANVHAATIRELKIDGIVKNLNEDTLNKVIIGKIPTLSGTKEITIKQNGVDVRVDNLDGDLTDEDHIGDLTVEQLMLYMGAMLDIISV
mgnify:CR=1 FL=1